MEDSPIFRKCFRKYYMHLLVAEVILSFGSKGEKRCRTEGGVPQGITQLLCSAAEVPWACKASLRSYKHQNTQIFSRNTFQ
jgi:hypothetical protein